MKTVLHISNMLNAITTLILIVIVALKFMYVPAYVTCAGIGVIAFNLTMLFALKPGVKDTWMWLTGRN